MIQSLVLFLEGQRSYIWAKGVTQKSFESVDSPYQALDTIPCANVDNVHREYCHKQGTMRCGACKLVSYCSRDCQKLHWRVHKESCKNTLRDSTWSPVWIREGRPPCFVQEGHATYDEHLSVGISLWGQSPALDLLNLIQNEKDNSMDLNIAFIASGDLRHIVKTVNSLPIDYDGHLKILLNDHNLPVVGRNIILLLILATVKHEDMSADVALHFWYSLFMPRDYKETVDRVIADYLLSSYFEVENSACDAVRFGSAGLLHCEEFIFILLLRFFRHAGSSTNNPGAFQHVYDRVMKNPFRQDLHDRRYIGQRPSHRVSFEKYRSDGLVLPFGADRTAFTEPNCSLFSFDGLWAGTDQANPLDGWDLDDVVSAGKLHGAPPEDIYGCLYFFLRDEVRTFARKIRNMHISFVCSGMDALSLSTAIKDGKLIPCNIPPSTTFNRIHVSNIIDHQYVGLRAVFEAWIPLLSRSPKSTLVGHFLNWVKIHKNGRFVDLESDENVQRIISCGMADILEGDVSGRRTMFDAMHHAAMYPFVFEFLYDNSGPFQEYLQGQGLNQLLQKEQIILKTRHTVVPHRSNTPIDARPEALPTFTSKDSKYYHLYMSAVCGFERFIEVMHRI